MDENIMKKIYELQNYIDDASWDIQCAADELDELKNSLSKKNENTIKDINNFIRELKRDDLYTDELERFIEQYMKYYNK